MAWLVGQGPSQTKAFRCLENLQQGPLLELEHQHFVPHLKVPGHDKAAVVTTAHVVESTKLCAGYFHDHTELF